MPLSGAVARKTAISSTPRYQAPSGGIDHTASCASRLDDGVDVAARHRVHVALDDLAQALVAQRAQGGLLAAVGQALVDRLAGALQGAVDRGDRRLERLGDLLAREAQHLAQDERGALVGRQVLERRHEGQLDALAALVAGLGGGAAVDEPELLVGIGLDPRRLDERAPGGSWGSAGGPWSIGSIRLGRRSMAFSDALVAIRYSHERSELRPSKRGRPRHARSRASWRASSASWTEPSIR